MNEDECYEMKKNRSKKNKMGIKTSNTVKYNESDQQYLKQKTTFEILKKDTNNEEKFNETLKYNVQYSINKDKRWELIKELEKEENVLVAKEK
jgi:hypothetical protein